MATERARTARLRPPVRALADQGAVPPAPLGLRAVLALQRAAGNRAVAKALGEAASVAEVQRDPGPLAAAVVAVTGVRVTPAKTSVPVPAGTAIRATATPANATGVRYALEDGSASVAGRTTINSATGVVTVDPQQPGGSLTAKATSSDGTFATLPFNLVETPGPIDSTTSSVHGDSEAHFVHTFSSGGASVAGLEGANINERFAATSVPTPFGRFTLSVNAAGSHGWDLDSSGTMAGPDELSWSSTIDATPFIQNASNPTPAGTLPQGFEMTQSLHAKTFPTGRLAPAAFTTTQHARRVEEQGGALFVVIGAGTTSETMPYVGPPVFRNATVDQASVEASEPRPRSGTWNRSEANVSVEALPDTATPQFWISGKALGCTVDSTGKVLIGDHPGTITVRAGSRARSSFDAVTITITPRATP